MLIYEIYDIIQMLMLGNLGTRIATRTDNS